MDIESYGIQMTEWETSGGIEYRKSVGKDHLVWAWDGGKPYQVTGEFSESRFPPSEISGVDHITTHHYSRESGGSRSATSDFDPKFIFAMTREDLLVATMLCYGNQLDKAMKKVREIDGAIFHTKRLLMKTDDN